MAERKTGLPVDPTSPLISRIISPLVPMSYQVDQPYSVNTQEVDGGVLYSETPMKVSDPQFAVPPAITEGIEFFKQFLDEPTETASGIATAVGQELAEYPQRQIRTALAGGETYNPETGEVERYDPFGVPATTALGSAASIARVADDGSTILGIMAGRNAHDGDRKFQQFTEAKDKGMDERAVYAETKGYIEPSDNAFRFEIDTSNAKLNKEYFKDSGMEDVADGAPYQRFQFEEFTKKEGRPPTLGDLMEFKELYYQYPELSDIEVKRVPFGMLDTKAAYDPIDNVIYISSAGPRQMISNLLHEVQHAVQHAEGHVTGSGVRQYLPEGFDEQRRIQSNQVNRSAAFYADKLEKQAKKKGIDANLYKYNMARKAKLYFDGDSSAYGYEDLSQYATDADLQDLRLLADDFEKLEAMDAEVIKAGKMYFRQPGEVEARTAQTKYIENRQGEFPLDVQDVAPEDYFYRIDSKPGVMESRRPRSTNNLNPLGVMGILYEDEGKFFPTTYYHGTTEDFKDFKVGPSGAIYLTDAPEYADEYAGVTPSYNSSGQYAPIVTEGANIRPVYIKDDINIFNPENPEHANILREAGVPVDEINPYLPNPYDETFLELMMEGDYDAMESVAPVLKEKGFDGYQTYEGDTWNYAIFDPKNLVSATAKKAEGGVVSLLDIAQNMTRGPKGLDSLIPIARNMNRSMVS